MGDSYKEFEKAMFVFEEGELIPAKEKVGVSYEELPPADRMTDLQTQQLLEAMLNALAATGVNIPKLSSFTMIQYFNKFVFNRPVNNLKLNLA